MSELAEQLSDSLARVVEGAAAGVVRVAGRRRGPSSGAVWSEDGLIVTTHHVLEWDEGIEVTLADGRVEAATLVGRDPGTDLAALRVAAKSLTAGAWSDAEGLKVGHLVLGLGRPGRSVQASLGIVSTLGGAWRSGAGGKLDRHVQTSLPLQHGFSGSTLLDAAGRVLGLNTAGLLRGVAVAVPSATVRRVMDALLAHGEVRRGFLGITTQPVALPGELEQRLGQASALLVTFVQPDAPAARAGLLLGDVLVSFDGQPLRHPGELLAFLEPERIGTEAHVRLVRGGEVKELALKIGAREGPVRRPS